MAGVSQNVPLFLRSSPEIGLNSIINHNNMKKTLSVLPFLALFMLLGQFASAQFSEIKFENNSDCPVTVLAQTNDSDCKTVCSSSSVTVPANTLVSIPLFCLGNDKNTTTQVQIMDGQSTATVGTGCGFPVSTTYLDCFGNTRTLVLIAPNYAQIN